MKLLRRLGMDWVDVGLIVVLIGILVLAFQPWEIGRASCRERVSSPV